jgi:hypothetical protein
MQTSTATITWKNYTEKALNDFAFSYKCQALRKFKACMIPNMDSFIDLVNEISYELEDRGLSTEKVDAIFIELMSGEVN